MSRHVVVTGGGSGLGAAIAKAFDAEGDRVTVMGRRADALETVADSLRDGASAVLDVTDAAAVEAVFAGLNNPVDILVNNAGIAPSKPFRHLQMDDWHDTFNVNIHGVYYCIRAVVDGMVARDAGRVINVASTSALKGYAYVAAYCASKHAVLGLTRALAAEYARSAVTFNAICPGFAETDLLTESVDNIVNSTGRSVEQARKALAANNPQQRFIQPEEVAATAVWLAGDAARSITGQAISISGGETV